MTDGGPAFPSEQGQTQNGTWNQTYSDGMSLRDYFAAAKLKETAGELKSTHLPVEIVEWGYIMADAMLKARER